MINRASDDRTRARARRWIKAFYAGNLDARWTSEDRDRATMQTSSNGYMGIYYFLDGGGEMLQIMPPLAARTGLFLHETVE